MTDNNQAMKLIEQATKTYNEEREKLQGYMRSLNSEVAIVENMYKQRLDIGVQRTVSALDELKALLQRHKKLFTKPRTKKFFGTLVGFRKQKGKVTFEDADKVVALIKQHMPDEADLLIDTTETPAKSTLDNLPSKALKKLGCELKDAGDKLVIKPVKSDVDKHINALIKGFDQDAD